MSRLWLALGGVFGLLAVAMSAVAAHAAIPMLRDAAQMQGWHALALLFCALRERPLVRWAGAAFAAGVLLFCGDIYALAFAGVHLHVAPVGGVLLMAGWALLGVSALRDA
jgi:uncharacterized membrane protein YgdD (TMEM256/DUF423 family)